MSSQQEPLIYHKLIVEKILRDIFTLDSEHYVYLGLGVQNQDAIDNSLMIGEKEILIPSGCKTNMAVFDREKIEQLKYFHVIVVRATKKGLFYDIIKYICAKVGDELHLKSRDKQLNQDFIDLNGGWY